MRMHIGEDLAFQRRDWRVERISWVAMSIALVAALLGAFGSGPLSKTTAGDMTLGVEIEYQRFWRVEKEMPLRVRIRGAAASAGALAAAARGEAAVWLDNQYLRDLVLERVEPQPIRTEVSAGHRVFVFATRGSEPVEVVFRLRAERFGFHTGRIGPSGDEGVLVRQFVYP
jgi:hypothetical protein